MLFCEKLVFMAVGGFVLLVSACAQEDASSPPDGGIPVADSFSMNDAVAPPGWQLSSLPGVYQRTAEAFAIDLEKGSELEIEVPENMVSLTVAIDGEIGQQYWICGLQGPEQQQLVPDGWGLSAAPSDRVCSDCPVQVRKDFKLSGTLIPNSSEFPSLRPGTYSFRICRSNLFSDTNDRVDIYAHIKESVQETGGTLDLDLHFVAGVGPTAATAPTDPTINNYLARAREILGVANLVIGQVRYFDADERFLSLRKTEMLALEGETRYDLFEAHPGGRGLDVYFIKHFADQGRTQNLLGLSNLSGPGPVQGLGGVVIALDSEIPLVREAIVDMQFVLPHEIGHFLGLFHTSESAGTHDLLDDTPEDDPSYLMHYNPTGGSLSPRQRAILLSSPWVRQ